MKKGQPITAFYVESLLLILVFIGILLALTQVFGLSRNESLRAKLLTNTVTLAQNAADDLFMEDAPDRGERISRYAADMTPDPEGPLSVLVTWQREGDMLRGTVTVRKGAEELYALPIARYVGEVNP